MERKSSVPQPKFFKDRSGLVGSSLTKIEDKKKPFEKTHSLLIQKPRLQLPGLALSDHHSSLSNIIKEQDSEVFPEIDKSEFPF